MFWTKSEKQKKQDELQEMALHHLLTYPRQWDNANHYYDNVYYKGMWYNKKLGFRIGISDRSKYRHSIFVFEDEHFILNSKVEKVLLKDMEQKAKVKKYNAEQKAELLRQEKVHKAKDKLWKELQDKAEGKEPEKSVDEIREVQEKEKQKTIDYYSDPRKHMQIQSGGCYLDLTTGRHITVKEYHFRLHQYLQHEDLKERAKFSIRNNV